MTTNQSSITGPKSLPMLAVPLDCTANSASRIDERERHHIGRESLGDDVEPSSALRTEMAGVMMPSP